MKKTKEMFAGGFYLLKGQSSANSTFIEDKEEAIRFMKECNKRLKGYATIHDYLLTKDGWILVISLLEEKTIKKTYKAKWKKSLRVKKECFLDVVWRIISEQVRQIRFTFVLYTNRKNGREGSKVKKSYERYWFENLEEAIEYLTKMRKQLVKLCQKLRTYHSKKKHFRISKKEAKGAVFLCSLNFNSCQEEFGFGLDCMNVFGNNLDVLRKAIKSTILLHLGENPSILKPKIE